MSRSVLVLTEAELRNLVAPDEEAVRVIEAAFGALAGGDVIMPPIMSMDLEAVNGEVDVKTAYIPGFDGFAIKVSPGFFDNPKLGLPSLNGLMILFAADTGLVKALLLDNGYLTAVRTAAAGGLAADYFAPANTRTAGVFGSGAQGRLQMQAAHMVRPFDTALVWDLDEELAAAGAKHLSAALGVDARVEMDGAALVAASQLVITATPAREPLLMANWLHPGLHITAMGADQAGKNEIDPNVFSHIHTYVPDRISQTATMGELRSALEAGVVTDPDRFFELGDAVADPDLRRQDDEAITMVDLTGTGAQDTAIATHAHRLAQERGVGSQIET